MMKKINDLGNCQGLNTSKNKFKKVCFFYKIQAQSQNFAFTNFIYHLRHKNKYARSARIRGLDLIPMPIFCEEGS